jgi:Aminotransferase class I and II
VEASVLQEGTRFQTRVACMPVYPSFFCPPRTALLYTVPTHNNPCGTLMPADRRERLVRLAEQHGFFILADEVYQMLSFPGGSAPRLLPNHAIPLEPSFLGAPRPGFSADPACRLGPPHAASTALASIHLSAWQLGPPRATFATLASIHLSTWQLGPPHAAFHRSCIYPSVLHLVCLPAGICFLVLFASLPACQCI